MLNLFRRKRDDAPLDSAPSEPARPASVGADRRVYAIGDVHGRLDLLKRLYERIIADCERRGHIDHLHIVMLGDLVDRGPDSRGVVDMALRLSHEFNCFTCLMGNHEEVFAMALRGEPGAMRFFLSIGGWQTIESYGVDPMIGTRDGEEALLEALLEAVPEAHRDYIYGLPDHVTIGDYLFVHAGIRPGVALDAQEPSELRWIREPFLRSDADHGSIVIHGHSITDYPDEQPNRIGIDTGAYMTDRLTALGLEGEARWYLGT